jgi:hypothetical protein
MVPEPSDSKVFSAKSPAGVKAFALIIGGLLYFVALGFVIVKMANMPARPDRDESMVPGILGGASVVGVMMIAGGIYLLRSTRRVVLDPVGVHVETYLSRRLVRWYDIHRVERDKKDAMMGMATHKVLRLIGSDGKTLETVADTIDHFDIFDRDVVARSAKATGRVTSDPAADEQRQLVRENKKLKWVSALFALFTLGMIAGLVVGINEEQHKRKFATEGATVDAKIVRRYMFNVTPHVEYSFQDEQGRTFTKDVMMYQGPDWDAIQESPTIPVIYLRSDPTWNKLVRGEQTIAEFGGKFIFICAGGILVFGTLFLVTFLGFDIKSENGVTRITRRGREIKAWGRTKSSV